MNIRKELLSFDMQISWASVTPGRQANGMGKNKPSGGFCSFHSGWSSANPRAMERYGIVGGV
jgi:hypothetical protein